MARESARPRHGGTLMKMLKTFTKHIGQGAEEG